MSLPLFAFLQRMRPWFRRIGERNKKSPIDGDEKISQFHTTDSISWEFAPPPPDALHRVFLCPKYRTNVCKNGIFQRKLEKGRVFLLENPNLAIAIYSDNRYNKPTAGKSVEKCGVPPGSNKESGEMVKGEYRHTIDAKGRLAIPAKFREELGDKFTITIGMDGCLAAYPEAVWEKKAKEWDALPGEKGRLVRRYFGSGACETELDSQGRVLIPANLRNKVGLKKNVCVIGISDYAEIWDEETWDNYNNAISPELIGEIMEY